MYICFSESCEKQQMSQGPLSKRAQENMKPETEAEVEYILQGLT
jgi:hypothetical protein